MRIQQYQQLASELKSSLDKFKPIVPPKKSKHERKVDANRKRYLKWKASLPPEIVIRTNNRIHATKFFAAISSIVGITPGAARARYYRHQLPAEIIERAKAKLN